MSEENPRKASSPRKKAEKKQRMTKGELERKVAELEAANAALRAEGETSIQGADAAGVSYPTFFDDLRAITQS